MCACKGLEVLKYVVRPRRYLAGSHVDMEGHLFRCCRKPALIGVAQLLKKVCPLLVEIQKLQAGDNRHPGFQLAHITDMDFRGEKGRIAALHIVLSHTQKVKGVIHTLIKQDIIVGHVQMTVVVDPVLKNVLAFADEGRVRPLFQILVPCLVHGWKRFDVCRQELHSLGNKCMGLNHKKGSPMTPQANPAQVSSDRSVAAIGILVERFGERCVRSEAVRVQHGHTTTWIPNQPPEAVVYAQSTEEVAEIVRVCAEHKVPVIPFGTGSSLEGHVNAPMGGVSIDLSGMNEILSVSPEDLDCRVQAGVTRKQLNAHLRDTGLFFPIDPGADASLGGMASTRASGTNAVRYGTMRDAVLGLTIVTPQGEIVRTGGRARKSSAGYDLTRLMVGAEGTLGVITELQLRLFGIPEAISGGICPFPDVESACNAVISTIQCGIPVARIELLDKEQVRACNTYSKLDLVETPTLFLEFHGSQAGVKEQSDLFNDIATEFGGGPFVWETQPEARTKLWEARHNAYWAAFTLRPGSKVVATDVCVPISRLAECVEATRKDIDESGFVAPIVGHVGDGNFHVQVLIDETVPEEIDAAQAFVERLNLRAIEMDGTCTGEHGVGQGKVKYMRKEHGNGVTLMQTLKAAIDPDNIMNPGKILPPS